MSPPGSYKTNPWLLKRSTETSQRSILKVRSKPISSISLEANHSDKEKSLTFPAGISQTYRLFSRFHRDTANFRKTPSQSYLHTCFLALWWINLNLKKSPRCPMNSDIWEDMRLGVNRVAHLIQEKVGEEKDRERGTRITPVSGKRRHLDEPMRSRHLKRGKLSSPVLHGS
ncbi:hypothetical protein RRG08_022834 [Elysia crispata]|uniref:Uncharacterized protein n=1 Tax=Elysia crispata TaxID=231223 RepID=A0AAE0Z0Q2_9GAST|nr:hypothetical protein RRG08_022834 [Elysia crispata]